MDGFCKCGGTGTVEGQDGRLRECWCAYIRRRASDMTAEVRNAEVVQQHLHLPVVKAPGLSLRVKGHRRDVNAVIKVTMLRNPNLFLKITSDREILDVFLGKASKAARGDDSSIYYNSIQDLVDSPVLSVVRLNEISYKNKAASGALEEALNYRLDRDKPTWVVERLDRPFSLGSPAWSESVEEIIRSSMRLAEIPEILQEGADPPPLGKDSARGQAMSLDNTASAGARPPMSGPPKILRERPVEDPPPRKKKIQSVPDDDEGVVGNYGVGLAKKKPFRGRV